MSSTDAYNARKIAAVSNLPGTTLLEVAWLVLVVPLSVFFALLVDKRLQHWNSVAKATVNALLVLTPTVVVLTEVDALLPSAPLVVGLLSCILGITWIAVSPQSADKVGAGLRDDDDHVSLFRFSLLLMTCIMILAIDFPVTPRRLGKTETFGTGLMDVGTGGFIVSSAIIGGLRQEFFQPTSYWRTGRKLLLLLGLGLTRLVLTRSSNYQKVVTEYGVHWNFFFTLAFALAGEKVVQMLCVVLPLPFWGLIAVGVAFVSQGFLAACFVLCGEVMTLDTVFRSSVLRSTFLTLLLSALYEALLRDGLQDWVLQASREESLLASNKEGIVSCIGYVALRFGAHALGGFHRQTKSAASHLSLLLALYAMTALVIKGGFPISRRLANSAYIFWVLALSQQILCLSACVRTVYPVQPLPAIVKLMNNHQLLVFLAANLLTGTCNKLLDTLETPNWAALVVMLLYTYTVALLPVALQWMRS